MRRKNVVLDKYSVRSIIMLMEANRWMFVKCSTDVVTSGIFLKDE